MSCETIRAIVTFRADHVVAALTVQHQYYAAVYSSAAEYHAKEQTVKSAPCESERRSNDAVDTRLLSVGAFVSWYVSIDALP